MNLIKKIFTALFTWAMHVVKMCDSFFGLLIVTVISLACLAALSYIGTISRPAQGIILNFLLFGGVSFFAILIGFHLFSPCDAYKIWKKIMKK